MEKERVKDNPCDLLDGSSVEDFTLEFFEAAANLFRDLMGEEALREVEEEVRDGV